MKLLRQPHACFVSLDNYGDLMLREPLLRAALHAGYRVTVLLRAPYQELLSFLDPRIFACPVEHYPWDISDPEAYAQRLLGLAENIRALRPDVVVFPVYTSTVTDFALAHLLAGIPRIGFQADARPRAPHPDIAAAIAAILTLPESLQIECSVHVAETLPESQKSEALARQWLQGKSSRLGLSWWQRRLPTGFIWIDDQPLLPRLRIRALEKARAKEALLAMGIHGPYAVLCPFAVASSPLKIMPIELAVTAGDYLHQQGKTLVFTGIASDRPMIDAAIQALLARGCSAHCWIGGPGQIGTLLGLIAGAELYVGNDTGPTHFAAALGKPIFAVYGGAFKERFYPASTSALVVTQAMPCEGCQWQCGFSRPHCLTSIQPERIVAGLARVVAYAFDRGLRSREVDTGNATLTHQVGLHWRVGDDCFRFPPSSVARDENGLVAETASRTIAT